MPVTPPPLPPSRPRPPPLPSPQPAGDEAEAPKRGREDARSTRFRREREETWRALERLVDRVERKGVRSLRSQDLARLPQLYRSTLSALSVARSISLDRNLREYLELLAMRAYLSVYAPQKSLSGMLSSLLTHDFPAAVRRNLKAFALSAALMVSGSRSMPTATDAVRLLPGRLSCSFR